MTENDIAYLEKIIRAGVIQSPCLEIGVASEGNFKSTVQHAGYRYSGADRAPGPDVDFVVDFEQRFEKVGPVFESIGLFGSVLLLNVLEHTFDPLQVLDNAVALLKPAGTLVVIVPVVWPIHNCPRDHWRINPDFYDEYCKRRSLTLVRDYFEYVGCQNVDKNRLPDGIYVLPSATNRPFWNVYSRLIHRIFNPFGRGMSFPSHVAIGAVIRKTPPAAPRRSGGS